VEVPMQKVFFRAPQARQKKKGILSDSGENNFG